MLLDTIVNIGWQLVLLVQFCAITVFRHVVAVVTGTCCNYAKDAHLRRLKDVFGKFGSLHQLFFVVLCILKQAMLNTGAEGVESGPISGNEQKTFSAPSVIISTANGRLNIVFYNRLLKPYLR